MRIINPASLSNYRDYNNHLYIVEKKNSKYGLHAFIAIHNNNLGPATGGTRIYSYKSRNEAITDVLRLSQAMTYKCAISEINHGGGKGVIIANPSKEKSGDLLKAYAELINVINEKVCSYTTGEDVGINGKDIETMSAISPFIVGTKEKAGDPSPYAALSTYLAMKEAVRHVFGKNNMNGIKVAIKGIGKVGSTLVELLIKDGARLYISDINKNKLRIIKSLFPGVIVVDNKSIKGRKVDIYSPCALGKEFNTRNTFSLKCKIICGAANNQLSVGNVGDKIFSKGVWYVPDYVANCGGLINVVDQLDKGGYNKKRVLSRIRRVGKKVSSIFEISEKEKVATNRISDKMGEKIFRKSKSSI